MGQRFTLQLSLFYPIRRKSIVKEPEQVSKILDANPKLMDLVFYNLTMASRSDTGMKRITAEHVLRCAVLKQYRELTYEELAFHLEDSHAFCIFLPSGDGTIPFKVNPPGKHQGHRGRNRGSNSCSHHRVYPAGEDQDW